MVNERFLIIIVVGGLSLNLNHLITLAQVDLQKKFGLNKLQSYI